MGRLRFNHWPYGFGQLETFILTGLVIAINILHPLFHFIEGGTLDGIITYMNAYAGFMLNEVNYND